MGFYRGRVARRFQEADGVRERGLGDGPRAICLSLFTYYCFSSPHPLCEVPDLGVGGGRAGSRSPAMYGAGGGGKPGERFSFFFLRFRSLQGDCDGSSKQAFGGPQPARLSERFLTYSSLYLRGDRLDRFTHEQRSPVYHVQQQ